MPQPTRRSRLSTRFGRTLCNLVRSAQPSTSFPFLLRSRQADLASPPLPPLSFFARSTSGFLTYLFFVTVFSLVMIYKVAPVYGKKNPVIYTSICSVVGSISVMAIKVSFDVLFFLQTRLKIAREFSRKRRRALADSSFVWVWSCVFEGIGSRRQVDLRWKQPVHPPYDLPLWIGCCWLHYGPVSMVSFSSFCLLYSSRLFQNSSSSLPPSLLSFLSPSLHRMNYLNKALDTFPTNVVNPMYYVFFSTATIIASLVLFQGLGTPGAKDSFSLLCGFLVIFMGVYLLNLSRDPEPPHRHGVLEAGLMRE